MNDGYNEPPSVTPGDHTFIESSNDPNFPINAAYGEVWTYAAAGAPTLDENSQVVWSDAEGIQAWGDYHAVFSWDGPPNPGAWQLSGLVQLDAFGSSGTSDTDPYNAWDDPTASGSGYSDYLNGSNGDGEEARMSSVTVGTSTTVYNEDDSEDLFPLIGFANNNGNDDWMEGTVCDLFAQASAFANVYNGSSWALSQGQATASVTFAAYEVP